MRNYLVKLRNTIGETQEETARAIGITRQYYGLIEAGERQKRMDISLAARIASHFNISIEEIIQNEGEIARAIAQ